MKFYYYGIRGTNFKQETNDVLETSYVWDFEMDRCTYGEENEEELGGVCVTIVNEDYDNPHAPDFSAYELFDNEDELNEAIEKGVEYAKREQPGYTYYYLVGSNDRNPEMMEETDDNEGILADAVVLKEV